MLAYGSALSQRRLCASGLVLRRAYPSWLQAGSRSGAVGVADAALRWRNLVGGRSSAPWSRVLSSNRTDDSGGGESSSGEGEGPPGEVTTGGGQGGVAGTEEDAAHVAVADVGSDGGKGGGIGAEGGSAGGGIGSTVGGGKGRKKAGVFGKWWRGSQGATGARKEDERDAAAAMAAADSGATGSSSSGEESAEGDGDGGNPADNLGATSGEDDVPSDSMAAIVPAGPRPENFPKVLAVPLTRRPLFPGFFVPVTIKDAKLAEALSELKLRGIPYVGAFLRKDLPKARKEFAGSFEMEEGEAAQSAEDDNQHDLHEIGTFAQVHNVIRLLDGEGAQVLLMGHRRLKITGVVEKDPLTISVEHLKDKTYDANNDVIKATIMEVVSTMKDLMRLNPLYKEHIQMFVQHVGEFNAARLADFGASLTTADEPALQAVLETLEIEKRLSMTLLLLKKELELSKLQADIGKRVEEKISGEQRKFFLLEQLKSIKKELGLEKDDKTALVGKFEEKLAPFRSGCPPQVLQVIEEEITKLQGLETSSSEFNVTRNYLDWLTSIPWGHYSEENFDVARAQQVLDADHYGLTDVKERILEFIAVGKLRGSTQGKIICLSGPPGVGKTSIGRSIAHALNRKFYRFSVGGLSDVAEIKGHRRTYVGAMPGKMVQCLKATGTANPLVLIDEIDKLGHGHAGDPASALLELLDPEQNANFLDHYLDVHVDLSKVLFVCTANVVEAIPGPLLDRMEVIRLVGYISDEKMNIARHYLEPAARTNAGVNSDQAEFADGALHRLIETYCREAGVRNLQKHIEKIYRKIALKIVRMEVNRKQEEEAASPPVAEAAVALEGSAERSSPSSSTVTIKDKSEVVDSATVLKDGEVEPSAASEEATNECEEKGPMPMVEKIVIDENNLCEYVGNPVFQNERLYDQTPVGVVMGLAWTAMGGSTLYVETSVVERGEGKGGIMTTGQLGDVMKESTTIAHTLARRILAEKEPGNDFFSEARMHLHVPAGATPKDGPSAGCTMITSMLSLAMNKPVRKDLAMTGEVTLTGRVLPIGGVKEKTIAARRSGVKTLVFPEANQRDFEELPAHVKEGLNVHFVQHYEEIFKLAFGSDAEDCQREEERGHPMAGGAISANVMPLAGCRIVSSKKRGWGSGVEPVGLALLCR